MGCEVVNRISKESAFMPNDNAVWHERWAAGGYQGLL